MNIGDFSVLMSVYVKEKPQYLVEALQSIDNQELFPNQIVIVKDGPLTPKLDSVLEAYKNKHPQAVTLIANKENHGLAYSLQRGLSHCRNQIVARADSDDVNYRERFLIEYNYLDNNPQVSVVGCQIDEYDPNVGILGIRHVPYTTQEIFKFAKKRNPLNHMSVMFRKQHIISTGGYEQISLFEDYFLWVKLLSKGRVLHNLPESLVRATVDSKFYSRRGGWAYFKKEVYFQYRSYKIKFLSRYEFFRNIILRTGVRLFPKRLLGFFYQKILRN